MEPRFEVMYDGAINGKQLNLNRFVEIVATTPAKMFGLYPKKGTIAPGADADIVIFDMKKHPLSVKSHHMQWTTPPTRAARSPAKWKRSQSNGEE